MAIRENSFLPETGLEALLLIAGLLNSPDVYDVVRVRYLADKAHLSEYGFLGSRDHYVAMAFGAVPSYTYEILKLAREDMNVFSEDRTFAKSVRNSLRVERGGKNRVKAERPMSPAHLSDAEIACIRDAAERYARMPEADRQAVVQDNAWLEAWTKAEQRDSPQHPMSLASIAQTLDNAEEVAAYLFA